MANINRFCGFLALILFAGIGQADDGCDFDQRAIVSMIAASASKVPGGTLDKDQRKIAWVEPSGNRVSVWHAGCVDLGTAVTVSFPSSVDTRTAVQSVLLAAGKYWSAREARDISSVLAARQATISFPAAGVIVLEAPSSETPGFPFGFTLRLTGTEASLSWQEL